VLMLVFMIMRLFLRVLMLVLLMTMLLMLMFMLFVVMTTVIMICGTSFPMIVFVSMSITLVVRLSYPVISGTLFMSMIMRMSIRIGIRNLDLFLQFLHVGPQRANVRAEDQCLRRRKLFERVFHFIGDRLYHLELI
jgi:hypothetical protein